MVDQTLADTVESAYETARATDYWADGITEEALATLTAGLLIKEELVLLRRLLQKVFTVSTTGKT